MSTGHALDPGRRITIATLLLSAAIPVGALLIQGSATLFSLIAPAAPLAVHAVACRLRSTSLLAVTPPMIISLAHYLLFASGVLVLLLSDGRIPFAGGLYAAPTDVAQLIARASIAAAALVTGWHAIRPTETPGSAGQHLNPASTANVRLLAQLLWILAATGLGLTCLVLGGPLAAHEYFSSHDRTQGVALAGSAGSTLWSLFALPAALALTTVYYCAEKTVKRLRLVLLAQALFIASGALFIFGSRLTVMLMAIGAVSIRYYVTGRFPSIRSGVVGVILAAAISSVLLDNRSSTTVAEDRLSATAEIFSYSVLDVSVAVANSPRERVADQVFNPSRWSTLLASALPVIGPAPSAISQARLDVLTVRSIGTTAQAETSGLPMSLPTALVLGGGLAWGALLGFAMGIFFGLLTTRLFVRRGALSCLLYGALLAGVFNLFKDGDIPQNLSGELSRYGYVLVLYGVCATLTRRASP